MIVNCLKIGHRSDFAKLVNQSEACNCIEYSLLQIKFAHD